MKLFKYVIIYGFILLFCLTACDSTEQEGGGGLQPGNGEPYIIEGFTCGYVDYEGNPVAIDNDFFQDEEVHLWLSWGNVEGEHELRIIWVDPDDEIVSDMHDTFTSANGRWVNFYYIDTTDSAPIGQWLAEIYIDGVFKRSYAFWLLEG